MKIIFLDIDGVLINLKSVYEHRADPKCVERLNRITAESGAVIVVSSSWRDDPKIAAVLKGWGVEAKVVGVTPRLESNINGIYFARTRGEEIDAWLREHRNENGELPDDFDFVILDDDADMGNLNFALVQTDFETGLTDSNVIDALDLLTC